MNNEGNIEIPRLLGSKVYKTITFAAGGLTISKPNGSAKSIFVPSENLNAFRYGILQIRGYAFIIGWHYFIEIQDDRQNITSIRLNSYYRIKGESYYKIWTEIIHELWANYFVNIYNYYYELYKISQTFDLCGVKFIPEGITWDGRNILQWHEIGISNYATYFMIYNVSNKRQNKSSSFARDWNAVILQSVLKEIVEEKKVVW